MPEKLPNLASLVIGALDDFAHVEQLQLLLKIGLAEADHPSEEACERLALLVDVYAAQVGVRSAKLTFTATQWLETLLCGSSANKNVVSH